MPLVGLIPEILVKVGVGDLLQRFDVVDRDQMAVEIHEFDVALLEGTLGQQVTLDTGQGLMGVVVCLLYKTKFFTLRLIQSHFHRVGFLESLQRKNEEFRIVFVREGRERDRRELPTLQPTHTRGVDRHCFFRGHIRTILKVVVLTLLFVLEPQSCEAAKILFANSFIDCRTSPNALPVVVCNVCPPICLRLHVAKNHVLNGNRKSGDLPRNIRLPASPSFAEML
mmetsp:Transcript_8674/g.16832  ORF Transcript_8674/g.16832 Transcript_8674/m.16832 type:complete len:225 (-) Transcript_8674:2158-2832(-)